MLKELRRWLGVGTDRPPEMSALTRWAERGGHHFKAVRGNSGCVITGGEGAMAWRAEWGQSQRHYIAGPEMRLIGEPGLPKDIQALVINRVLGESIERAVFEQYVDDVKTQVDAQTPPETRWLVMFPKLGATEMGDLRSRYTALGNSAALVQQWLQSPLRQSLTGTLGSVGTTEPVVLTIARGRVTLRTAMATPDTERLALWMGVFLSAMQHASALAESWREVERGSRSETLDSTQASILGIEH